MNETITTHEIEQDRATILGFWLYLMTDLVLFASLFATFMVLRGNTFGGVSGREIFDLPFALKETLILLASSFTVGVSLIAAAGGKTRETLGWLSVTAFLGLWFIVLEVGEFTSLIALGHGPDASGFLSAYFTLVGTHGFHVVLGLVWMAAVMLRIAQVGLNRHTARKLALLATFWHFLDIVWIFIFTIVYLLGVL
jgi:cytochrome o ubiquinol oxidase subunit 3